MEENKKENNSKVEIDATKNLLAEAIEIAKKMKEENEKAAELLAKREALEARAMISGRSQAGQVMNIKSPEEELKDGMKGYFKDTAIEELIK